MVNTQQDLSDLEDPETMPMFQYKVTAPGQASRTLIAYGNDEAQALGRVVHALSKETGRGTADLPEITNVGMYPNPTVIEIDGTLSAV